MKHSPNGLDLITVAKNNSIVFESCNPPRFFFHEIVFGLLCGFFASKLLLSIPAQGTILFPCSLAFIFVSFIIIQLYCKQLTHINSNWRWRIRFGYYPLLANVLYFLMGLVVPMINPTYQDPLLQSMDKWIVGTDPNLLIQNFIQPWLSETLSLCYLSFFIYLFSACIRIILLADLKIARCFLTGLSLVYAIGFLGYYFFPALGPYDVMKDHYTVALDAGPITRFTIALVTFGSNHVDEFPSLHCAISAYILMFDWKFSRNWFYICILPVIGLYLATVYLRFHYLVDAIAGLALAVAAFLFAIRFNRNAVSGSV